MTGKIPFVDFNTGNVAKHKLKAKIVFRLKLFNFWLWLSNFKDNMIDDSINKLAE